MPASTNLFKVLAAAEDPSQTLEDEIGCMTGIFQMFDRSQSFTGSSRRRYGSKRVISAATVHSRQVSACESPHHDTSNSSVHMFEDNAPAAKKAGNLKHIKATAVDLSRDHHHRGYSDSNNIVTKTCKAAPVPMQDQQQHATDDQKNQQQLDQECTYCEDPSLYQSQVNSMSVVEDSDQSSSFPHNHREEHQKLPLVSLRLDSASEGSRVSSKDLRKVPFLDIRDIVRASFYRERSSRDSTTTTNGKEKARALLDLSHESLLSKSLPRSSSVNGWDHRLQMSVDRREEVCCSSSVELPRCSSVDARMGGSQMLGDWRTTSSLRSSSVKSPRRTAAAAALLRDKKDVSKVASVVDSKDWMSRTSVDSKFARHFSSPLDGKDVTRLMVELKEDPRLSVSGYKDEHQGVFNDDRNSPRPPSPGARYYPESRYPAAATTAAFFNFKETRQSADLKDPCSSASCTPKVRDGNLPRFSIDAARDPPRASMSPRLSVDSRDSPRPSALLPRLKLDRRDSMQPAKLSCRDARGASSQLKTDNVAGGDGQGEEIESHRRIPNVVARLMGLEELPGSSSDPSHNHPAKSVVPQTKTPSSLSSREVRLLQGQFLEHYTPPPPPRQSDDYNYKQQRREEFQQLKKECPIPSHAMQLSIKSSSSSSLPGPNQKETRPESSLCHLHCYYDQDLPLQYQQEEGFWTHAQEKIGGAQQQMKAPLSDVVLTALKQTDEETKHLTSGQESLCSLVHQEIHQLHTHEKSVQGRTFFRYILKALQLKGPLHSPRHKESRDVNTAAHQTVVPKPIVEESKTRMQMLKQKFLVPSSPRLAVTVPKQENAHQAAGYQGFAATKVSQPVDLLSTMVHHEELLIAMKQTNSCAAAVQDTGTIMHGSIPDTFMIAPKCIDEDPVMNEMTTSSHHPSSPAPPGDLLDSISSRSWSSGRSAVTSSVQTNTLRASSNRSSMSNGAACKGGENDEAAANRRSSQVHQVQTSSGTSRHEPNGSGTSDIEAATTPRMARKERITARSAKGSQEGTQGGRDMSAKSPRLSPLPQGKHGLSSFPVKEANPLRPGSSSPGMRCMTGTGQCPQLVENGKKAAWSKPFVVKDREDSKVTLLNTLRAQSTKQEFLKGRASTGPDTLRTYNRRSSESSKLISRITEKLTATNAAAAVSSTKAHGRRLPISEHPILSSKRSTGKHSNPAVNSKTTSSALDIETTRPAENTSTKEKVEILNEDVAPVVLATAAADDHMERDETNNMELMMESIQPNAVEESRLDLPTTLAELDQRGGISEVLTPRGVSVKKNKYPFSEFEPAEVVDQPSPVSVLDNFHFQEEDLSPSPRRASKPSTTIPAEDVFDSPQRHDFDETQAAALKGVTDIIGSTQNFSNHDNLHINRRNHVEIQIPIDSTQETYSPKNTHGICLQNKDEERKYVRDILVASGVTENASSINCLQWTTGESIMDLTHFNDLESRWQQRQPPNTKENDVFDYEKHQPCSEKEALGRRVLFDGTNEILFQKLDPVRFSPLQWLGIDWPHELQQKPAGQQLVQEVWDELQDVPCVPSSENNICDTLYTILHKDFRKTAKQWSGMDDELSHVSSEVEHMIVKELIEEIVKDLVSGFSSSCNLSTHKPVEAIARRLLFAH